MKMKASRSIALLVLLSALLSSLPLAGFAQEVRRAPEKEYVSPPENFGFVPPRFELYQMKPERPFMAPALQPSTWDWRSLGGVTSVKNQNPYGTCWAFGYLGCFESMVLINESTVNDYSELNVVACNPDGTTCDSGGNAWMAANYLSLLGTVEETCNPYPGDCPYPTCINPACDFLLQVTEWRVVQNDVTAIKEAIMNWGPVNTAMYAGLPGFNAYDGTTCLSYTGTQDPNHGVLIVGWDDSMCGGNGAWIVKNSWGTSWGESGYFYIEYGSAQIGIYSNVVTGWKDYDPIETIYHWDENGWVSSLGYGDRDDWGMVEFTPTADDELKAVSFWATGSPTNYTINIYDDFTGGVLNNELAGPLSGILNEEGYYTIDLPVPLELTTGDQIYIAIRLITPNYDYPVPFDPDGPMETNKSYISNTGTSWIPVDIGYGADPFGDIGIRARAYPPYEEAPCINDATSLFFHSNYEFPAEVVDIYAGQVLGPFELAVCIEGPDTICVHAEDTEGWYVTGDLDECTFLDEDGCHGFWQVYVEAPLDAQICDYDTVRAILSVCDVNGFCAPHCATDTTTLVIHVVEPPPALEIFQDTLTFVDMGVSEAFVAFQLCNGNPAAGPRDYGYVITSIGYVGQAINQTGTLLDVPGGECGDVYASIDASTAVTCDYDTLTIVAWSEPGPGIVYDTCVQVIHVVAPLPVPLFSGRTMAVLGIALIAVAAVFFRKRFAISS
jgi:C1A family cysteine protease